MRGLLLLSVSILSFISVSLMPVGEFTAIVMLAGWWVFDHVPGTLEWMGVGLIATCGVAAGWLSARQPQRPDEPRRSVEPSVPEP